MKKFICFTMLICILTSTHVTVFGSSDISSQSVFYYDGREIHVSDDSLDYEVKKKIADSIALGDSADGASTYGIACLFGHDLAYSTATELVHNVYSTSPKCVKKYYDVEACTRSSCDYAEWTVTRADRYSLCHG